MRSDSFKASAASDSRPGPRTAGASQRHDREEKGDVPGIIVTGPEDDDGVGGKPDDEDDEDNPIFSATLDERRKVYGHNVLRIGPRRVCWR